MAFEALDGHNFMSLKTFRKSGEGVATPVWFAKEGDVLYLLTSPTSGKMKRLRNNAQVEVAPCDGRGGLVGEDYLPALARELKDSESRVADQALTRKYGFQKRVLSWLWRVRGRVWHYVIVTPASTNEMSTD